MFANTNSSYNSGLSNDGKKPIDYGILQAYIGEKLEIEPPEWNTTDELGITFGERLQAAEKESYEILIVDPERALPWMNGTVSEPYAVKYNGDFYRIMSLWVDVKQLKPSEDVRQWQFPLGTTLAVGWVFTGVLFLKRRRNN